MSLATESETEAETETQPKARAHCNDCGWEYERALREKGLEDDVNREITEDVARNHEFLRCPERESRHDPPADVDVDLAEGV